MAFTVRDLVEVPFLKTRVLAGRDGAGHAIHWAHSCELAAPWDWLGRGDLLMTNGFAIPADRDQQVVFVRKLEQTGIAGVAIGEGLHAPPLAGAMLAEADRLGFPVLSTAYDVPFIAVAQAVAQANRHGEQERMTRTMRIYEAVRQGAHETPAEIVRRIGADLATRLHIVDRAGAPLLDVDPLEPRLREQIVAVVDERDGSLPAITRVPDGARQALVAPVPASEFACLVARPRGDAAPALSVLQHVAAVVAIEIERSVAQQEAQRRLGSELLAHLIDRRIDAESGGRRLADFGLGGVELVLLAVDADGHAGPEMLNRALRRDGVPTLQLRRSSIMYVLLPSGSADDVGAVLDAELVVGASAPLSGVGQVPDAAKEARWALEAARGRQRGLTRYGQEPPPFMPRTVTEARSSADAVLGDLLAYDAEHSGDLVRSLRLFLAENRSWQRASTAIGVHKQTLVYRMRRVEELTGRRLDDTGDVAYLWLALSAHDLLSHADEPIGLQPAAAAGGPSG
ncbi:MAG TPA: PucR family transcriptional regulator ligand-binding domain-containing protein [Baekduia sp.]|uniref:PucR family transcriptional regulator n=1 Tax=Baekduia sp. TaxID=2600305 RepID=UPI002D76AA4E|nr:PucR family transcriptional regulator ligand-binding domain-containing protein [Baekduia sp.]HET6509109.1 PucR family transcriptional regulator ligand-binding domain-containing protein [Baekduia sp.]